MLLGFKVSIGSAWQFVKTLTGYHLFSCLPLPFTRLLPREVTILPSPRPNPFANTVLLHAMWHGHIFFAPRPPTINKHNELRQRKKKTGHGPRARGPRR